MGFDEVPGDLAATLACEGFEDVDLHITYALPRTPSLGTLRTTLEIMVSEGPWRENGSTRMIRAGEEKRWAPMPPPLGPKPAYSFPLALGHLAPLHLDVTNLRLYAATGTAEGVALKWGAPVLRYLLASPARPFLDKLVDQAPEGPTEDERGRWWTILAEARSGSEWRNVAIQGPDLYGVSAEMLSLAAEKMSGDGYDVTGVVAPVQAVGKNALIDDLKSFGVSIETYAPL
jgi:short subunit dehydrogenase-like uncharacterized protein